MNYKRIIVNVICFDDGNCTFNLNIDDPNSNIGVILLSCTGAVIGLYYDGVYYVADYDYSSYMMLKNEVLLLMEHSRNPIGSIEFTKLWDGNWCNMPCDNDRIIEMCKIVHEVEAL